MLTAQHFIDIHARFVHSGLSIRSFCSQEGLCEATFYYWRRKMKPSSPGLPKGFVPVLIDRSDSGLDLPAVEVSSSLGDFSKPISFEVCYPNGTSLKLEGSFDLEFVKSLIQLTD